MIGEGRATAYVGAAVVPLGGADPGHRVVVVADGVITATLADPAEVASGTEVVDLGRAWLAPGFVDAHVHATATGLAATGVDAGAARSGADLLMAVRRHVAEHPGPVVHGSGWDDLVWPDGRPSAEQLAEAAGGRTVVLTRVDGHSCLVDAGTLARLDVSAVDPAHVHRGDDGRPTGWLLEGASAVAAEALRAALPADALAAARRATCERALDLGITTLHEMGIPALSDRDDALTWATGDWPITVHAYWASMDLDPDPGGPLLPGGDLFLDGSIGSCTAACTAPYRTGDGGSATGALLHDDEAVAAFFTAATRAGVGAGVHAIGDAATGQAVRALRSAADACGIDAVRAARHRIEHVELITREQVAAMAEMGVVASVQPAFDAVWGGPGGLYEQRFGRARTAETNPFAWFAEAGVDLCLSSDSTVTPMDPWGGVLAAERHHGGLSLDRRTALDAATLGGHRAVRAEAAGGALLPGRRADLVAWPGDPLLDDPTGWTPVAVVARGARRR